MKTRKRYLQVVSALLFAFAALVGLSIMLGTGNAAQAAPAAMPTAQLSGGPLAPLPAATCPVAGTVQTCELWAKPGTLTMPDGMTVPIWGFAASESGDALIPGPVIRAQAGYTLELVLNNEIYSGTDPLPLSLGFPAMDGVVPDLDGVLSGMSKTYTITIPSQPGTYLYEAGLTSAGARQVAMGLSGTLIVEDSADPLTWDQEVLLFMSEIDPAFNADPFNYSLIEFQPHYWLLNGQAFSGTDWIDTQAGNEVMVRYLNGGSHDHFMSILGLSQNVVGTDGARLLFPYTIVGESVDSGQTLEALVQIPADMELGHLYPVYDTSLMQHNNNQRLTDGRAAFGGMMTFLRVTDTVTVNAGPVPSNLSVTPNHTNGQTGVVFEATLTDAETNVVAYEIFTDTPGTPGTNPVPVTAAPVVNVSATFDPATLANWDAGEHTIYVVGQDDEGKWGAMGSAIFMLEKGGPRIIGMSFYRSPANGEKSVLFRATGDDRNSGNSAVVAGEYRIDGGAWTTMALNRTNHPVAAMTATIDAATVAALGEGLHTIEVRAQDDDGNWSAQFGAIDLAVDQTGPDVPATALNPTTVDFTQPIAALAVRLTGTLTDPVSAGGPSKLVQVEGFIDGVGAPGTGFTVYPADGLFDEVSESIYYNIPLPFFAGLSAGGHDVYLVGQDSAGNWSTIAGSATITVVK